MTTEASQPKPTTLQALAVYAKRHTLVMLVLGFSAGLPNLLIFDTLSAWLREAGLSLEVIAFFSLATLAYSFKFLWAPLIDRTAVPLLTKWLGHRRSWMLVCQALLMVGLWLVAGLDPTRNLGLMALFAVLVGFTSATQDIVIDAWRIEAAPKDEQGAMAASYQWGYRLAIITAGAAPLVLAEQFSWNFSYAAMASLMLIGVAGTLAAPREMAHTIRPIHAEGVGARPALEIPEWLGRAALILVAALVLGSGLTGKGDLLATILAGVGAPDVGAAVKAAWEAKPWGVFWQVAGVAAGLGVIVLAVLPLPGARTRPGVYLSGALLEPLMDFMRRYKGVAGLILALICVYRLSDFVLNIMNPFYLDLGFSKIEIAEVRKVFGVVMSMLGVGLGGLAVARFGLMKALVVGAFAGPLSNLAFAWMTTQGPQLYALFVAIGIDNVASGFAGTCLIAYMSSLTSIGFTATQYALFSSLYALPGKLLASQSGRIVESSAASADTGGAFAPLKAFFTATPPETFAGAWEKSNVSSAAALGAGYMVFFLYSTLVGILAVVLVFVLARKQPSEAPPAPET